MATLAITGLTLAAGSGASLFPAVPAVLAAVGNVAALAAATYIDSAFIYPALFGEEQQAPEAFQGMDISTQDTGAPRMIAFGSQVKVPCHLSWLGETVQEDRSVGGK